MQQVKFNFNFNKDVHYSVLADKDQLLRVFNNLIRNGVQAIPESRQGLLQVDIKKEDNHIIISIADNGTGIEDSAIGKIFSPNFTTKTGGMGLGLAIVKSILDDVKGKIWYTTKSGQGTVFFVSFPCF